MKKVTQQFFARYFLLKYEDLATDPVPSISNLYSSLGLEFGPDQLLKVEEHVGLAKMPQHSKPRQYYSTYRMADYRHDSWRGEMEAGDLERVQRECRGVMELLGYQPL